jgi:hypothetical protein
VVLQPHADAGVVHPAVCPPRRTARVSAASLAPYQPDAPRPSPPYQPDAPRPSLPYQPDAPRGGAPWRHAERGKLVARADAGEEEQLGREQRPRAQHDLFSERGTRRVRLVRGEGRGVSD